MTAAPTQQNPESPEQPGAARLAEPVWKRGLRIEAVCFLATAGPLELVDVALGGFGLPDHTAIERMPAGAGVAALLALAMAGLVHLRQVDRCGRLSAFARSTYCLGGVVAAMLILPVVERPITDGTGAGLAAFVLLLALFMRRVAVHLAANGIQPKESTAPAVPSEAQPGDRAAESMDAHGEDPARAEVQVTRTDQRNPQRTPGAVFGLLLAAVMALALSLFPVLQARPPPPDRSFRVVTITRGDAPTTPTSLPLPPDEPKVTDTRAPEGCRGPAWGDGVEDNERRKDILKGAIKNHLGCPEGRAEVLESVVIQWSSGHVRALVYFWDRRTSISAASDLETQLLERYLVFDPSLVGPDWFGMFEDLTCGGLAGWAFGDRKIDPLVKAVLVQVIDQQGTPRWALIEGEPLVWWVTELRLGHLRVPDRDATRSPPSASTIDMSFDKKKMTFGAGEPDSELLPTTSELRNLCAFAS